MKRKEMKGERKKVNLLNKIMMEMKILKAKKTVIIDKMMILWDFF